MASPKKAMPPNPTTSALLSPKANDACAGGHAQCGPDVEAPASLARSDGNIATAGFAVGGLGVAGAAVLFWLTRSDARAGLRVAPRIGRSGTGVDVAGAW